LYFMCRVMGRLVLVPPPTWLNWKPAHTGKQVVDQTGAAARKLTPFQLRLAASIRLAQHPALPMWLVRLFDECSSCSGALVLQ
jgi:hypothetical protein